MKGIILGSVIGNTSGIIVCCWHFFRRSNTLKKGMGESATAFIIRAIDEAMARDQKTDPEN